MELLSPHFGLLFWTLIAFALTFFLLVKFAWKPIVSSIKSRENKISEAIEKTNELHVQISNLKAQNDEMLSKVREEKVAIMKQATEESQRMIEESKTKAKLEAEKIMTQASEDVANLKNKAFDEVKEQIADIVILTTEKILKEKLKDKKQQEKIISNSIKSYKLN